jgi:hypothetical protein
MKVRWQVRPSKLQTDTGLIAFTELDPGRLQSSTQLVDGPCTLLAWALTSTSSTTRVGSSA